MNNQPREIQNGTANTTPSPAIEAAAQSAWSRPTEVKVAPNTTTGTNENPNSSTGTGDSSQQQKQSIQVGDQAPQVMTKPNDSSNDPKGKEGRPTLSKEIPPGAQEKPIMKPPLMPPGWRGQKSMLNTRDNTPALDAVEPSDASLDAALASVADSKASDTAKTVASALLKGETGDVADVLQELENDPDGKEKLEKLAGELTDLLGTKVEGSVNDGKFGLKIRTQESSNPIYEFEHEPGAPPRDVVNSTTSLYISSSGEVAALRSSSSESSWGQPTVESVDGDTEATRLQAIGVHSLNNQPMGHRIDDGRDRSGNNHPGQNPGTGTRPVEDSRRKYGPISRSESGFLEIPPFQY